MTLDFSRVNWFYVSISNAIWLALVIARWRRGDISLTEQYLGWSRQNGQNGIHLNATDWVATASSSDGGPGEPNRVKAAIGISTAFWAVLLWFLAFPLHVVKWQ